MTHQMCDVTVDYFTCLLNNNLRISVCSLGIDVTPVRHLSKPFLKTACVERLRPFPFLQSVLSVPDTLQSVHRHQAPVSSSTSRPTGPDIIVNQMMSRY